MFCYNCGKEVDDKACVCVGCGVFVKKTGSQGEETGGGKNWIFEFLSILFSINAVTFTVIYLYAPAFVFSALIFGIAALVLGIIAFTFSHTKKLNNKFNAIIAFSLSISAFIFALFFTALM